MISELIGPNQDTQKSLFCTWLHPQLAETADQLRGKLCIQLKHLSEKMFYDVSSKSAGKCQQDRRWEESVRRWAGDDRVVGVYSRGWPQGQAQRGEEGGGNKHGGGRGLSRSPD